MRLFFSLFFFVLFILSSPVQAENQTINNNEGMLQRLKNKISDYRARQQSQKQDTKDQMNRNKELTRSQKIKQEEQMQMMKERTQALKQQQENYRLK